MLYGRVLKLAVCSSVASAIVLDLDDDTPQFAARKTKDIFHNRCILTLPANIPYQHSQPAACFQRFIATPQTHHEELAKLFIIFVVAQVIWIVTVPDDVPIWRVYPTEIELARQRLFGQVKAVSQISSPVRYALLLVLVESLNNVFCCTGAQHWVSDSSRAVPQNQILE